jgi:hypothetical protein
MATYFKNVLKSELGTADTDVLTTGASSKTTVIGLSLANLTSSILLASIKLTDPNGGGAGIPVTAYFVKDILIPPNQSLRVVNGGEKLVLGASTTITMSASLDNSLDLVMSYVEII